MTVLSVNGAAAGTDPAATTSEPAGTAGRPALVLQHGRTSPPGLLAEWAAEKGIELEIFHTYEQDGQWPSLQGRPFLCCLGAANSPLDTHVPAVARTLQMVEHAITADVPVLGLCYGGQVLSTVLGGTVEHSPEPEHGWRELQTSAPEIVSPGPWLEWHWDRFSLPNGATQLASSGTTVQAFAYGPHLGTQFHPESTVEIVRGWARKDTERLASHGITDGEALVTGDPQWEPAARAAAFQLFDAFWERARTLERSSSMSTIEKQPVLALQAQAGGGTAITSLRVLYSDMHGIARGKDVPVQAVPEVLESGLCFCHAVMGTDLHHTPVVGGEEGYPDMIARPDLETVISLPWEPGVAQCLADLHSVGGAEICDPRGALRKAVESVRELGFEPIVGPELEFFLLKPDPDAPGGLVRNVDRLSMVYTVGPQVDPQGLARRITEQLAEIGLGVIAVNHEFMNSQYEINLRHSGALDAADRAFRLKNAVKDIAALGGLAATFMGKPFNDQGGSGMHLHVSLEKDGTNVFDDPTGESGLSGELRHFTAGLIEHAAALTALLNPTINAYRRIQPDSLAPTHANWGLDNRATMVRIPPERGRASRVELRVGDGAANPYLAIAAVLYAGADGIRRRLEPPAALSGDAYRADAAVIGAQLPTGLDQALQALAADEVLREGLGAAIVDTFTAVKSFEIERHRAWVSDWEIAEYVHHL